MKTIAMTFLVIYNLSTPKQFKGTVMDANNKEKLAGVMVVANKVDTVYTDFDGNFVLKNFDGIKTLDFNLTSYKKNDFILVDESVDSLSVTKNEVLIAKKI